MHGDNTTVTPEVLYGKHFLPAKRSPGDAWAKRNLVLWTFIILFGPQNRNHGPSCRHSVFFCSFFQGSNFLTGFVHLIKFDAFRTQRGRLDATKPQIPLHGQAGQQPLHGDLKDAPAALTTAAELCDTGGGLRMRTG